MLNRFLFSLIIFYYALFAYSQSPVINEGMSYILSIDRTEVKDDDIIIKLHADINIDKGYYIQSCDPELSLSPTSFEWQQSSNFKNLSNIEEPNPKVTYNESLDINIGKHYNNIEIIQEIIPKDNILPGKYNLGGEFLYQICDSTRCIPYYDEVNLISDEDSEVSCVSIPLLFSIFKFESKSF